ncbi:MULTISPECIES: transglycosylase SLT domain-containing protein [Roseicella]|uniref:transglycosylase SLT domain-containing protein n=1 Tax=Roseicella TaxID=2730923 RepID=UPI0034A0A334
MPAENVAAVARQESGFHPLAIRDEQTDRSYFPETLEAAETLATSLTAQGHLLGVGLMQLTPPSRFGLSIREALDACKNMRAGAELLATNYRRAIRAALSTYNSGHPTRAEAYARSVEAHAARMPPIADPSPAPTPSPAPAAAPTGCAPSWDVWARCRRRPQTDDGGSRAAPAAPVLLRGSPIKESR